MVDFDKMMKDRRSGGGDDFMPKGGGWGEASGKHEFETFTVPRHAPGPKKEIVLSSDQEAVYEKMLTWAERVGGGHSSGGLLTVGGVAGSGKSTLLAKLIDDCPNLDFTCAAFTGKAANALGQKLSTVTVSTIHSIFYRPVEGKEGEDTTFETREFEEVRAGRSGILALDEASMIDERVFSDISRFGLPILAIGDHGQLPPINGRSVLMEKPMLRLETIHRQAEGSPIIQLSKTIRERGRIPMPPPKGIRLLSFSMLDAELTERLGSATSEELHDFAVLCYKNSTRTRVNDIVRRARFGPGAVPERPLEGDIVVCLRNQPPIYNGMRGTVKTIDRHKGYTDDLEVVFPDDGIIHRGPVVRAQFGREKAFNSVRDLNEVGIKAFRDVREIGAYYDYGYCLTVHKAQGSGFKTVYMIRERPGGPNQVDDEMYKRWMYTGATRAVNELVIVSPG